MMVSGVRGGTVPESPSVPERSLSVIVTAMNEEGNLRPTVDAVLRALTPRFKTYEVIVIDDGSRDRTPEIADELAAANPRIVVRHMPQNMGLAHAYRTGIEMARYQYTAWIAGNNLVPPEGFERIYDQIGNADVVIAYILRDVRGGGRRFLSRSFTRVMNTLFGTRLRYFTGPCVYRTQAVKGVRTRAQGSMFVAELLLRVVTSGQTCVQVGIQPLPRTSGSTKTFRLKNVVFVLFFVLRLFVELRLMSGSSPSLRRDVPAERDDVAIS